MIYSTSAHLPSLERRLQLAINRISEWATDRGFTLSQNKTVGVYFHRTRTHAIPALTLNNRLIVFRPTANFLGITFDSKMTWKPHIQTLKGDCLRRLDILKNISNSNWGADTVSMLRLYRALVRSKLDYGCVIYASARENILKLLDPVHNSALRICTGAFRSSPVVSLYAESGEASLSVRREQLSLQFLTHIDTTWITNIRVHLPGTI